MTANGIPRKLARKVAWAVAMSTAAYGVEAIWERQEWLFKGFNKLTAALGRAVAGIFSTAKGDDAMRAADIPPTRPMLDRRRERLLAAVLAAPEGTPKKALLPAPPEDDSSRRRIPAWFLAATDGGKLIREGQSVEGSSLCPRLPTLWSRLSFLRTTCYAWTDGSF